jgi:hypothetical protein
MGTGYYPGVKQLKRGATTHLLVVAGGEWVGAKPSAPPCPCIDISCMVNKPQLVETKVIVKPKLVTGYDPPPHLLTFDHCDVFI